MSNEPHKHKLTPLAICGVFFVITCIIQLPLHLNHDAAWHFQTAFRFLAGDEVGVDIFDINPPMTMWISLIPASITNMTGAAPGIVFKLFFMTVAASMILLSGNLFHRLGDTPRATSGFIVLLCLASFIFPGYDFAQREQFTALLTLPYVISVIGRANDKALPIHISIAIGIIAAIGIGIKPYFLLLPILMELWLMVSRRSVMTLFRTETIAILTTLISYLGLVFIFTPGYLEIVIPDALSNYGGFSVALPVVLQRTFNLLLPYILVMALGIYLFKDVALKSSFQGFLISATAFLFAALLQKKGWTYQLYPAVFYLTLAIGDQLLRKNILSRISFSPVVFKTLRWSMAGFMLYLMIVPSLKFLVDGYSKDGTGIRVNGLEAVIQQQAINTPERPPSVFAFITSPRDVHPAVLNSRAHWAHNSGVLVYLPAAINAKNAKPQPANLKDIIQTAEGHDKAMIDSLSATPPDIFFVYNNEYKLGITDREFDYLEYYTQDEKFSALLSKYSEKEPVMWYRVFVRNQ